jgi:hypothetical protein
MYIQGSLPVLYTNLWQLTVALSGFLVEGYLGRVSEMVTGQNLPNTFVKRSLPALERVLSSRRGRRKEVFEQGCIAKYLL